MIELVIVRRPAFEPTVPRLTDKMEMLMYRLAMCLKTRISLPPLILTDTSLRAKAGGLRLSAMLEQSPPIVREELDGSDCALCYDIASSAGNDFVVVFLSSRFGANLAAHAARRLGLRAAPVPILQRGEALLLSPQRNFIQHVSSAEPS